MLDNFASLSVNIYCNQCVLKCRAEGPYRRGLRPEHFEAVAHRAIQSPSDITSPPDKSGNQWKPGTAPANRKNFGDGQRVVFPLLAYSTNI